MSDIREDRSEVIHYDDPDYPVFVRHNEISAGFPLHLYTPVHWHDEVELLVIEKGTTHHLVNEDRFTLHEGDVLFINSRQFHELIADEEQDCTLYCLIFKPDLLASSNIIAGMVEGITGNENLTYIHLKGEEPWKEELREEIIAVCETSDQGRYLSGMAALYRLWETLFTNLEIVKDADKRIHRDRRILRQMTAYIDKNYRERLTLKGICLAGGVGRTKCTELFLRYLRMPPVEYLRSIRLDHGAALLRETEMSVTEICYEVGFSGASYFGEQFKAKVGITPMEYRRESRRLKDIVETEQRRRQGDT